MTSVVLFGGSGLHAVPTARRAAPHARARAMWSIGQSFLLSLKLPRLATLLLTIGGVGVMAVANLVAFVQQGQGTGMLAWIDRLGPPFASALVVPLAPWVEQITISGDPIMLALRGLIWCAIATALLVWGFRRLELGN